MSDPSIAESMIAIAISGGKGDADALHPVETETPRPGPGQILIRIHAAGVNRPDLLQRQGAYPPPQGAPETLGLEVAGEVAALGAGAGRWMIGDKVCALLGGGGYAQFCVVDARHALSIPAGFDYVQAAGLPETVFTVFTNVFERGRLAEGETFMIHGATSGIGVTAIQMAKAAGARVIATSRGADKAKTALALGADISIDTKAQEFVAVCKDAGGADVILDMVGGDFIQKNIDSLRPDGRLVQIAYQAGAQVELDLMRLLVNRLTYTASTLRPRPADEKARLAKAIEERVWPWIAAGKIKPIVDRTFPLADAAAAHAYLEAGAHVGKVVLVN
ncbi:MAG: NAD(P)H-quinone oxidoreductase [Caulobacteraceae bacterium]